MIIQRPKKNLFFKLIHVNQCRIRDNYQLFSHLFIRKQTHSYLKVCFDFFNNYLNTAFECLVHV